MRSGAVISGKLRAMVALVRPELPIAAGVCVVVGQALALGALPPLRLAALGFALGVFLSGSAMVFNDYFDLEVDRVNAPHRPLPAGRLTLREAAVFGAALGVIALAVALVIQPLAFALSLAAWVLGFLYNWKLKAAGLWGNLLVSANVAMTIFMGGVSVGQAAGPLVWVFGLIAGLFDLAEEIAGDAMDMAGDRERASRSLALVHGRQAALRVSAALFGVVVLLTFVPLAWGETGLAYLLPVLVMDAAVVFFTTRLVKSRAPEEGRGAMRALYLCATAGLVAIIGARVIF